MVFCGWRTRLFRDVKSVWADVGFLPGRSEACQPAQQQRMPHWRGIVSSDGDSLQATNSCIHILQAHAELPFRRDLVLVPHWAALLFWRFYFSLCQRTNFSNFYSLVLSSLISINPTNHRSRWRWWRGGSRRGEEGAHRRRYLLMASECFLVLRIAWLIWQFHQNSNKLRRCFLGFSVPISVGKLRFYSSHQNSQSRSNNSIVIMFRPLLFQLWNFVGRITRSEQQKGCEAGGAESEISVGRCRWGSRGGGGAARGRGAQEGEAPQDGGGARGGAAGHPRQGRRAAVGRTSRESESVTTCCGMVNWGARHSAFRPFPSRDTDLLNPLVTGSGILET